LDQSSVFHIKVYEGPYIDIQLNETVFEVKGRIFREVDPYVQKNPSLYQLGISKETYIDNEDCFFRESHPVIEMYFKGIFENIFMLPVEIYVNQKRRRSVLIGNRFLDKRLKEEDKISKLRSSKQFSKSGQLNVNSYVVKFKKLRKTTSENFLHSWDRLTTGLSEDFSKEIKEFKKSIQPNVPPQLKRNKVSLRNLSFKIEENDDGIVSGSLDSFINIMMREQLDETFVSQFLYTYSYVCTPTEFFDCLYKYIDYTYHNDNTFTKTRVEYIFEYWISNYRYQFTKNEELIKKVEEKFVNSQNINELIDKAKNKQEGDFLWSVDNVKKKKK